jgi:uncharacterized protein (DUF2252 family)
MTVTRKRWTTEEETYFLNKVEEIRNIGVMTQLKDIFEEMATWDEFKKKNRTVAALAKRYSELKNPNTDKVIHKVIPAYSDFLEAVQRFHNDYQAKCIENDKLKQLVQELEQQLSDYQMMARIMERTRKMIVKEELGEVEQVRLKMDQNGNLNRM